LFNISVLVGETSTALCFNAFSTVEYITIVTFATLYIWEWAVICSIRFEAGAGTSRHASFVV
jgi:hypothetical protein